ncbi:hypothetical protein B0H21DRAFT_678791, partial [Amylocystis lapponica]
DDAGKIEFFRTTLSSGYVATLWFTGLPVSDKTSWAAFEAAFVDRWPATPYIPKSRAEYQTELCNCIITEEELGTRVVVAGRETPSHTAWANKIESLAKACTDLTGSLITIVRGKLPHSLKKRLPDTHTSWATFCDAVHAIPMTAIQESLEANKARESRYTKRFDQDVRELRLSIQQARDLPPHFAPANPSPANRLVGGDYGPPGGPGPQGGRPYPRYDTGPQAAPSFNSRPPFNPGGGSPQVSPNLPHHPPTNAGRAAYEAQKVEWHLRYAQNSPTASSPYPLTPGTVGADGTECYGCGKFRHPGLCAPGQSIPIFKSSWRCIVGYPLNTARRAARPRAADIRYVGTEYSYWQPGTWTVSLRAGPPPSTAHPSVPYINGPSPVFNRNIPSLNFNNSLLVYTLRAHPGLLSITSTSNHASTPFLHSLVLHAVSGEATHIKGLFDNGAMVSVMCTSLWAKVRHRLGPLQSSSRILHVANGAVAPSTGFWSGVVELGGSRVSGSFEVFPSGGAWSFLVGKPLLEVFRATHHYDGDTITILHPDGTSSILTNQLGLTRDTAPLQAAGLSLTLDAK